MRPRAFLVAAMAGSMVQTALPAPAHADAGLEYAVKAAYLTKFIPFITWPDAPAFSICVLGNDPFAGKLEQAASGARSGDHAINVRHVTAPDPTCQIEFLGVNDAGAEAALEALRGKPVVTVTDSDIKARGVIGFVIVDNHVRFDIDDAAAAQDGLSVSSKLLGLARAVKQRSQP
jgi:hypothetical protein